MRYLLKWLVAFLAFALLGYVAGKVLAPEAEAASPDRPTCVQTTPLAQENDPYPHLTHIVVWPSEIEGLGSPYFNEIVEAWLIMGGFTLHWLDRWPLALDLPPGEYTLIIKRAAGSVQVIPLRVGLPEIPQFAFN